MKKAMLVLCIMCLLGGCVSEVPPAIPPTAPQVNGSPAATTVIPQETKPVVTIPLTLLPTPKMIVSPALTPPEPAESKVITPAVPVMTPRIIAGDYCTYPECDISDEICRQMLNRFGSLNSCMHLSLSGEMLLWRQHERNRASPGGYRITGDEIIMTIPAGWKIVSFESSVILFDTCRPGLCTTPVDTIRCTGNATALSCFDDAIVYMRAAADQW